MLYKGLPTGVVQRRIKTNGVDIDILEAGPANGPLCLLLHGFPELGYSWRHQLTALAKDGWHAVAPDQRGYGGSHRTNNIPEYSIEHLAKDAIGIIDLFAGKDGKAVVVGHDWGANITWGILRLYPERVLASVIASIPFVPADVPPTVGMRKVYGDKFFYVLYFQEEGKPEEELERDIRATMRDSLYSASGPPGKRNVKHQDRPKVKKSYTDLLVKSPDGRPPNWCSEAELDNYVRAFEESGFHGPISWYRNMDRNFEILKPYAPSRMTMPIFFIGGAEDPFMAMAGGKVGIDGMKKFVPGYVGSELLPGAGHWVQQEAPKEFNDAMLGFLNNLPFAPQKTKL